MQDSFNRRKLLAEATLAPFSMAATAQEYPVRPIRLVVPFPAGAGTDLAARAVGEQLQAILRQPVVIDNKGGAGGTNGAMEVVRAAPDGYTLLFSSNSALSSNVALQKGLPYDPRRDFSPIAGVGVTTLVLMVRADYPARDVRELIAHARRNPGRVSAGYGSSASQVAIAMLNKAAALDVLAVPYKSIPLAVTDVIGGVADFVFVDLGNAIAQARGGRLRALAVASEKRSELTPQWPPLSEVLPGFDIVAWVGIAGPAGMPPPVVEAPSRATRRLLGAPETREKLATLGFDPMPMDPPELGRFIHAETAKWIQLARDANIQPQ